MYMNEECGLLIWSLWSLKIYQVWISGIVPGYDESEQKRKYNLSMTYRGWYCKSNSHSSLPSVPVV